MVGHQGLPSCGLGVLFEIYTWGSPPYLVCYVYEVMPNEVWFLVVQVRTPRWI